MSAVYHQVPSQHAFFTAPSQPDHMDPWASTVSIEWGKGTRHTVQALPLFDDEGSWASNPSSPIFGALSKAVSPTSFLNLNGADPWAPQPNSEDENSVDSEKEDGSSSGGDDNGLGLYKTELCRSFMETGTCRYGLKCQFAHGSNELRTVHRHPKYKTEICKTFHTTGTCPYGTRCRFIHTKPTSSSKKGPSPVLVSPYSSPPLSAHSRSPSPPGFSSAPKWNSSWPHSASPHKESAPIPTPTPAAAAAAREEGDGENESNDPDSPSPSKKRLAIFRTISKDNLYD